MVYYIFRGITRHGERYMVLKKVAEEKDMRALIKMIDRLSHDEVLRFSYATACISADSHEELIQTIQSYYKRYHIVRTFEMFCKVLQD